MPPATSKKLEDQAATAALYVTRANTNPQSKDTYPLDADNRLSSAGAATSLKHANPRDLPSFPITGLDNAHSSAGAAASHANANHQEFKYWKPDASEPASKAAAAAKDYKAAPLWHPESSGVGSKAAHAASKDELQVDIWKPESTSHGNSAAGQAMRAKGLSPQAFGGVGADESRKALLAATGAVSGSRRRRAGSLPSVYPQYPDSANSAANALKAATSVSKPSSKPSQTKPDEPKAAPLNVARIHNAAVTNLSREMYTSSPPVKPELEERNRQAGLRAAALSMAKQMYDVQQKAIDDAAHDGKEEPYYAAAAANVHNRQPSIASSEDYPPAPQYVNLQEAAQKLASERLAKLHDEHAAFRSYYGANTPDRRRLSIRGRLRRRASSHGATPDSDEERSQTIRSEMSLFRDELAQVDAQKKQKDRDALLIAAQRNVRASMHGMDEKVFNDTGKASPAMREEWEKKAKERAKAESEARMVNHGRVNIGGGKYLDQSEIDNIAATRLQPTLDEITEKAEQQRQRDEELRRQQEERERIAAAKVADQKERDFKSKEEWKRFREEEKAEARAKKEEEKAKKAEEKRIKKEKKSGSKDTKSAELADDQPLENPTADPVASPNLSVDSLSSEGPPMKTTITEEIKIQAEEEKKRASALTGTSAGETKLPAQSPPLHAQEVAERVLSAPVVDPSEEIANPPLATPSSIQPKEPVNQTVAGPAAGTTETAVSGPGLSVTKTEKSEGGKVSAWLKNKLRRSHNKSSAEQEAAKDKGTSPGGRGGKGALIGTISAPIAAPATESSAGSSGDPSSSVREVAMAGAGPSWNDDHQQAPAGLATATSNAPLPEDTATGHSRSPPSSVSSLSEDEDDDLPRGRSQLKREETVSSGGGEGEEEEFEEARDHFEPEMLAPPGPLLKDNAAAGASGSPVRDSKFSEDL